MKCLGQTGFGGEKKTNPVSFNKESALPHSLKTHKKLNKLRNKISQYIKIKIKCFNLETNKC